jgi:hypothetical protein
MRRLAALAFVAGAAALPAPAMAGTSTHELVTVEALS